MKNRLATNLKPSVWKGRGAVRPVVNLSRATRWIDLIIRALSSPTGPQPRVHSTLRLPIWSRSDAGKHTVGHQLRGNSESAGEASALAQRRKPINTQVITLPKLIFYYACPHAIKMQFLIKRIGFPGHCLNCMSLWVFDNMRGDHSALAWLR